MINDLLFAAMAAGAILAIALLVSGIRAVNEWDGEQNSRFGLFVETLISFICVAALALAFYSAPLWLQS